MEKFDCLVLGAGIAGITAARKMVAAGFSVCLLDKSRGLGGRFATPPLIDKTLLQAVLMRSYQNKR